MMDSHQDEAELMLVVGRFSLRFTDSVQHAPLQFPSA